jgi:protein gp37
MQNSKIEWTDHTFNPWWGCEKVSAGCKNCYAETLDHRLGEGKHWGPNSERKRMTTAYWNEPYKWDKAAAKAGRRDKVFCASMADVFEDHPDVQVHRERLWYTILSTPNLDWQLLTKRPENILRMVPESWTVTDVRGSWWPKNVWIGTSAETAETLGLRLNHLLSVPAPIRFLSCEPLLGPLGPTLANALQMRYGLSWVIAGGESGPGARPMHPDWAREVRDLCGKWGVGFFFKQWGEYVPFCQFSSENPASADWPVVQFPSPHNPSKVNSYYKPGKKAAGSFLDGVQWKQFPKLLTTPR